MQPIETVKELFKSKQIFALKVDTADELLLIWYERTYKAHAGHYDAAAGYENLNTISVGMQAAIGTSLFITYAESGGDGVSSAIYIAVAIISFLTAMLSAQKFGEKKEAHLTAGRAYGSLKREIEQSLVLKPQDIGKYVNDLRMKWDDMERTAPAIPRRVWNRVVRRQFSFGVQGGQK